MPAQLHVHFLPSLTTPEELAGNVVVVIDVLRASTTICHALAAGAREVIPCLEVDEAQTAAAEFAPHEVVLGGERNGVRIDGFDLGNSPGEYTAEFVKGKSVVFTTTNGTKAMLQCRKARRVLIGSFVNLSAIYRETMARGDRPEPVHLLCSGTRGEVSAEDGLMAGALADRWYRESRGATNDQAHLARCAWNAVAGVLTITPHDLAKHLAENTSGGRNVDALGLFRDIEETAQIDRFDLVPELDLKSGKVVIPLGRS